MWVEGWSASRLTGRILALPEGSAYVRGLLKGHTSLHELLAQIRDAVTTTAHGWRWEGKPENYKRPESGPKHIDLSDPGDRAALGGFFGKR